MPGAAKCEVAGRGEQEATCAHEGAAAEGLVVIRDSRSRERRRDRRECRRPGERVVRSQSGEERGGGVPFVRWHRPARRTKRPSRVGCQPGDVTADGHDWLVKRLHRPARHRGWGVRDEDLLGGMRGGEVGFVLAPPAGEFGIPDEQFSRPWSCKAQLRGEYARQGCRG